MLICGNSLYILDFQKSIYYFQIDAVSRLGKEASSELNLVFLLEARTDKCYGTLWTLTILFYFIFLILLFFFFSFYFEGWWRGTWQWSHMTGHMMWHHKPRTWWKGLEDDVRVHGVHMVALNRTWGRNEDEA